VSEPSVLKTTLAKLIKQAEAQKVNPEGYREIYSQTPILRHFLIYAQMEMNRAADEANRRLKKKLGLKRNDDEILQFLRAIPVLQPYLQEYIKVTEKTSAGCGEKAYWILANHLRELLNKNSPALLKKLSAAIGCVIRDKKCSTHGELCVRWNYGPSDFFGREFGQVSK
jgi:hypothetical protein